MKNALLKTIAAAVVAVASFNACAGGGVAANGASIRPLTEFDLVGSGGGPVDIITPANAARGQSRRLQTVALSVTDANGDKVANVTCTVTNDKGSWSGPADTELNVERSSKPLSVTCEQNGVIVASTTVESAPTEIAVAPAPFFDNRTATVPAYSESVALSAVSSSLASANAK
jgi:hypothetical protein